MRTCTCIVHQLFPPLISAPIYLHIHPNILSRRHINNSVQKNFKKKLEREKKLKMKELESERANGTDPEKPTVCVLDSSTYVGFWVLRGLLSNGYTVHAAVQINGKISSLSLSLSLSLSVHCTVCVFRGQFCDTELLLEIEFSMWVFFWFDAGEAEIVKKIRDMEGIEEGLVVYSVDVLDYHSILEALKGCCALFCCLDSQEGYDDKMVDLEVRGAINVVEACAQTDSIQKIVYNSSLTAAIWRENISSEKDVDEKSWSNQDFCRKKKLWYALAKTLSEQAAWALAMDRMVNMVSVNSGLVLGPSVAKKNPQITMSYLQGAAQMYENGVLAIVDVNFLADVNIRAFEDQSTCGRYFCFNQIVNTEQETVKLAESLSPLISLPPRNECQGSEVFAERLRNKKLNKLVEGTAC
ncbi:cinnamoyl-CoA reductase-like SNL6 isoform X2 [Rhododendron vialii]|uniref:cinnamoyl-CoA reductase-like SNL6 isoform X2 n=1 Tax=Rhododendron vialii TaxID=182163 RepID=UPI00265DD9CA|nr:cinnamoyl-CoA reductase-like SNL6 isoform X2 [Rhododendron vialii]